ncbi:hypothetical protein RKE25_22640 (plasmid) [Dyella sp. BiH032]|uniref:hypothetical protein n=1 Tax=Dyella sp. BiH032 TaxID=3075430 RepID=UPI00289318B3|nr:hypothetical protein [Dyella sp. BiH032]WNL48333.1 hypothetical protein RKE25_22640 [Dyella sp. BiH032]
MKDINRRPVRQQELWDEGAISRKLAEALIKVIFGDHDDVKKGIEILIDVATSDIRMAKRIMLIMEGSPKIMAACPELYEKCKVQVQPGLTSSRKQ